MGNTPGLSEGIFGVQHAFLHVICRHEMKTVCRPSDRDVKWSFPVQGKTHHVQVKEPYGNSKPSSCNPGYTMYTVCTLLGRLDVMEERKKERQYAIAHKNMLFLIFRNMIWIVLMYCFC